MRLFKLTLALLGTIICAAHAQDAVHPDVTLQPLQIQPDITEVAAIVAEQRNKAQNELAMCHGEENAYLRKITTLENAIKAKDAEIAKLKASSSP